MDTEGFEASSLDELLNDKPSNEPEQALEPAPESEPSQPRDEHGRFAPKGEDESGSPPPVKEEPPLDHAAIVAERRRRQEAEQRAQALEAQLQSLQQPQEPPPSIWEDDQAALSHHRQSAVAEAVQQATFNARLDMSEMMVRQANPDFEDVKADFLALAQQNPTLVQQALADPHPWNKAYQIAKNHKAMTELGAVNVTDLEAKLRDKIMAEIQGQQPPRQVLPPTLTTERNVGSRSGPAWAGPTSLSELLR